MKEETMNKRKEAIPLGKDERLLIIHALKKDPKITSEKLAKQMGVTRQQVAAIKAWITMGKY